MAATFSDLVDLVRKLEQRSIRDGIVRGTLTVSSIIVLEALRKCDEDYENTDLALVDAEISDIHIGSRVTIQVQTPRPSFGILAESLDALLRSPAAYIREPQEYLLLDSNFYCRDEAPPSEVERYRLVLSMVSTLRRSAAFLDESQQLLVFVARSKFDVPVRYTTADLRSLPLEAAERFVNLLPDDAHKEQRPKILAEAISETLAASEESSRFSQLLRNARSIEAHFTKGYSLYISGFSYEKLKSELESSRIEYTGKIHKIFSDIQNQLVGIPIATVIVATQMKAHQNFDANFWINLAVLLGAFIFMLLMHFLLSNQRHTLDVLGLDIKRQRKKLDEAPAVIAEEFRQMFTALVNRYKTQRVTLYVIEGIVVFGFALAVLFFFQLSEPAKSWLMRTFTSLVQ